MSKGPFSTSRNTSFRDQSGHEPWASGHAAAPGKQTRTMELPARAQPGAGSAMPVQRRAAAHTPAVGAAETLMAFRPDLYVPVQRRASGMEHGSIDAVLGSTSSGAPMPEAVQAKMEHSFDTDLSAVRIYQDGAAEAIGAYAYTQGTDIHFAPGQYNPNTQEGQELIGHEVAHVVQQSEGRVQATMQAKGLAVNDDPALEREADEEGAKAARGEKVGSALVSSSGGVHAGGEAAPVQGYFKIPYAQLGARNVTIPHGTAFSGQDKDTQVGSQTQGSFLQQNGTTRTSDNAQPDLRIANAGDLAIEEHDLNNRQAKVFFATAAHITQSNQTLRLINSKFQLRQTGQQITVPNRAGNATQVLQQVTIENVTQPAHSPKRHGIGTGVAELCDDMSADVTGAGTYGSQVTNQVPNAPQGAPQGTLFDFVDAKVARYVAAYYDARQNQGQLPAQAAQTAALAAQVNITGNNVAQLSDQIAQEYGATLHAAANNVHARTLLAQLTAALGINEHAQANVGDTFVTTSIGQAETYVANNGQNAKRVRDYEHDPGQNQINAGAGRTFVNNPWGFHWGAVVAKSGTDSVTLENYARKDEDVTAKQNNINVQGGETRFYFQMYGDANELDGNNAAEDQSWHAVWKQLGFANPVTMAMHSRYQDNFQAMHAETTARQHYGDVAQFQAQHANLTNAATWQDEAEWLYRALSLALSFIDGNERAPRTLLQNWKNAVAAAQGRNHAQNQQLAAHVRQKLREVKKSFNLFS